MYKTVIFDYGNTLCNMGSLKESLKEVLSSQYAEEIGRDIESQISDYYVPDQKIQPYWIDVWKSSFNKFGETFYEDIGNKHLQKFCDSGTLYDYTIPLLSSLKKQGIKVILLSNATGPKKIFQDDLRTKNIERYFDKIVWSCEIGYRKPFLKIFEYALLQITNEKKTVLMIGDNEIADVVGAKEYGLDTLLVCDEIPNISQADFVVNRAQLKNKVIKLLQLL